jgi:signal transduction histidine kinase
VTPVPQAVGAGHFGLATMRDRAQRLRATLVIRSAPGVGACVTVALPG